jgi:signal transduction histidine kinase
LIVTKGADEGKQFDLAADSLSIGRDASNRVRLHDTEVSRRHAELVRTPEGYRILDVGSANGTFVNSRAIRDVLLQSGDQIQVGQSLLVYSAGRIETQAPGDLADRINLISRQDLELSSAIIKTIGETEGSRLLSHPEKADVPFLKANLGIIYEAIQAVSHILDLNQLLERLLELIFRSLDADRGCIMLRESRAADPGGQGDEEIQGQDFEPKALRWRDGVNRQEKIPVSRTIMDFVLREKQGILVSDAARDERFQAVQSIVRCGIREIICVPMKGRHETLGVLYLDSLTPTRDRSVPPIGKFNADHLALAIALAHQAALAVEETRYYQALVHAERLAAIGQTIAALSHHIKNILQGLKSGGEIIAMGLQDQDMTFVQKGWKIVEKNQSKIFDLVTDMLSYSKEREPNFEETDLNAVVRDVVELLTARAGELNIKLQAMPAANLPQCLADPEGLHRALLNVVGNALDAVEGASGPQVTVMTELDPDSNWVTIQVSDNGHGISPEKIADIFRPFVSTKGARGTGLGLAVSRKILREHGGDIVVQSQPGQGSTFSLHLPLRGTQQQDVSMTRTGIAPVPPPDE